MVYKIRVLDKEDRFLGFLLDCKDEILTLDTEQEAITTINIEQQQIEAELVNYEVVEEWKKEV